MTFNGDMRGASAPVVGFTPGVVEYLGYYVYLLIDPGTQSVFYVGKGVGHRWEAHLTAARMPAVEGDEFSKLQQIRDIQATGQQVRVDILRHGLDEPTAFEVEAATIDLLRLNHREMGLLTNAVAGHHITRGRASVQDLNADYGSRPVEIRPEDKGVLIRINREWYRGIPQDLLYEVTRSSWRIAEYRRKPGTPASPTHAFAVFNGIVRAAYAINDWESVPAEPGKPPRWAFSGLRDAEFENRYIGGDVRRYLVSDKGFGLQNPMRFVNC